MLSVGRWADGTTVTASSEHAPNVVDGKTRTYVATNAIDGDLTTFWNDDTQDAYPDTLTITAPAALTMHGVVLASNPDGAPIDFTIDTWDGTSWVTQADVHDNAEVYQWIPFTTSVTTSKVRIVVTDAAASFTRVAELAP